MDSRFNSYLSIRMIADRFTAGLMLVLLCPLFAIVSLLILCRMGRPLLFRQKRIGQFGATFEIIKFRTMVEGAETIGAGYMAPELDLIPPLGRFLRASSLDELPQLINILRGEMSFVGPRPALPQQYARYSPKQARRVLVPQGITGLAQVTYRNEATWSQRIEKDLEYIESIGFVTDMKLLLSTVNKVLRSEGVVSHQTAADVDDLGQNK